MVTCIFTWCRWSLHRILALISDGFWTPKSSDDWAPSFANAKEAKNCHMVYPDGHGCLQEFLVEKSCFGHFVKTFTPESEHEKKTEIYTKNTTEIMESHERNHSFPTERRLFPWLGVFTSQPTCERIGNFGERWRAMTLIRISWMSWFFHDFTLRLKEVIDDISIQKTLQSRGICCLFGEKRYRDLRGPKRGLARQCSPFCTSWPQICWSLPPLVTGLECLWVFPKIVVSPNHPF